MSTKNQHKAGFVNIIGKPNAGKSTLMNALTGEKLAVITSKAQTTRDRILGILNGDDFQIVYSDTPGIIKPVYELHRSMMRVVNTSIEDADIVLFVIDIRKKQDQEIIKNINNISAPLFLLLNKIDLSDQKTVAEKINELKKVFPAAAEFIPISAKEKFNIDVVFDRIIEHLPIHPPYFPKDTLTDKSMRFFAAEIIREKIFSQFKQEIPYSCAVSVEEFKEEANLIRIRAVIRTERDSQKGILIGHKGSGLKKISIEARKDMEEFFGKKIFLESFVKTDPDWRNKKNKLTKLGY